MPFEEVEILSGDGNSTVPVATLKAWLIKAALRPEQQPTVIFFHGNGGNRGHALRRIHALWDLGNLNLLAVDYRGYGGSEGIPSEEGLIEDVSLQP